MYEVIMNEKKSFDYLNMNISLIIIQENPSPQFLYDWLHIDNIEKII